jgi:signal transduction histidine kinase
MLSARILWWERMSDKIAALEQRLARITDPDEKMDALDELIRALWPGQLSRALTLAHEARDLADTSGNPVRQARALDRLGYLLWHQADYPTALTVMHKALNMAQSVGDRGREANILNTMAAINRDLGNYPDSLDYFYQALAIADELDDTTRRAHILNDIGEMYLQLRQPVEAMPYLQKSLAVSQEFGYESIEAAALDSLGQAYCQTGDHEQSLLYAQQCQALARRAGLLQSEIESTITLGQTFAALGQLGHALRCFNDALGLAREAGYRALEVNALVEVGKTYLRQKDPARALARLGIALNLAENLSKKQPLYEIHEMLAGIYAQTGDYRRAMEHYRQFHALKENVFNNQADHRVRSLRIAHDIAQARQQAEIYELKNVELQRQIDEKERLIGDLNAFTRMVAHDLKSPLSALIAYGELIRRDRNSALSDDALDFVAELLEMGYNMGRVIDDLLILAGVRQKEIKIEVLDMAAVVEGAGRRLVPQLAESDATLVQPDEWPAALGYPGWIEEVWTNYISNAIKYGGDPPLITLGATVEPDGMIRFWVQDNGPGISQEDQARLFSEFTRLDDSRADGSGLGLSIVRRIVERLGGEVGLESTGVPGEGSVFSFTLPAAGEAQDDDQG